MAFCFLRRPKGFWKEFWTSGRRCYYSINIFLAKEQFSCRRRHSGSRERQCPESRLQTESKLKLLSFDKRSFRNGRTAVVVGIDQRADQSLTRGLIRSASSAGIFELWLYNSTSHMTGRRGKRGWWIYEDVFLVQVFDIFFSMIFSPMICSAKDFKSGRALALLHALPPATY